VMMFCMAISSANVVSGGNSDEMKLLQVKPC
jgi:hypothetical protein